MKHGLHHGGDVTSIKRARRLIFSGTREPLSELDRCNLRMLVERWAGLADEIGVGDCPTGVDAQVREWLPEARVFVADWEKHGKKAGPYRNLALTAWAAEADSALLIAMPVRSSARGTQHRLTIGRRIPTTRRTSRGTWDCIHQAAAIGVQVVVAPVGCELIWVDE